VANSTTRLLLDLHVKYEPPILAASRHIQQAIWPEPPPPVRQCVSASVGQRSERQKSVRRCVSRSVRQWSVVRAAEIGASVRQSVGASVGQCVSGAVRQWGSASVGRCVSRSVRRCVGGSGALYREAVIQRSPGSAQRHPGSRPPHAPPNPEGVAHIRPGAPIGAKPRVQYGGSEVSGSEIRGVLECWSVGMLGCWNDGMLG
jgi:hypothetical protein